MSPGAWIYRALVVGTVLVYTAAGLGGWRMGGGAHERIPPTVRSSPGGYRSFHFWHTGFQGGK